MIKYYATIRPEYKDANIYVWDLGLKSMHTFSYLASRGIDVKGFVTDFEEYRGKYVCNRPVIAAEDFAEDTAGLLVVNDQVDAAQFAVARGYGRACRYSDIIGINEELRDAEYYLYGTGIRAWTILKELEGRGMRLMGYLKTEAGSGEQILGVPVTAPDSIPPGAQHPVILTARGQLVEHQMLAALCEGGYSGDIYVREMLPYPERWGVDPFLMLDKAGREHKQVILCCEEEEGSKWLRSILELYGYEVAREVCYDGSEKRGIGDIRALGEEDPERSVLLIFALDPVRRGEIIKAAERLGYSEEDGNYAGIQPCCYRTEHLVGPLRNEEDNRLPYSLDYTSLGGLPGWAVHGDPEQADIRILTLGGSTSSEVYLPENWSARLQRICAEHGFRTAVYNGAHELNSSLDQLIRLTRGLQRIKPDIVISLSGLNDFNASLNKFEAHPGENNVEYWRRIESYMKVITELEGGKFYAFVQPMNTCMKEFSLEETLQFISETRFNRKLSDMDFVSSDDFYCNMIALLQHRDGMFVDRCHYTDAGHEEIAEYVFETIKSSLR